MDMKEKCQSSTNPRSLISWGRVNGGGQDEVCLSEESVSGELLGSNVGVMLLA